MSTHHFGPFGGRFVAEVIWEHFERVQTVFSNLSADGSFRAEHQLWMARIGRPSPVVRLDRLSQVTGGASIWVKRDDQGQGNAYCAHAAFGQALIGREAGYSGVFCETVTGDFGVALASAANALNLQCTVFVGRADFDEEPYTMALIKRLGADVRVVDTFHRGRGASWSRAMRFWAERPNDMYCASSLATPSPYPQILDHFNGIMGAELAVQLERRGIRPDYVVAPVGSGAYASGLFSALLSLEDTQLVGVQGVGEGDTKITLHGSKGVMFGTKTSVLQDAEGLPIWRETCAGGLAHNAIGPQIASLVERGRMMLTGVADDAAEDAAVQMLRLEGIAIGLEAAHAIAYSTRLARTLAEHENVVVGITGGGIREQARSLVERA